MLLSDLSVKKPVFATVISLLLIAFGILSFQRLPLREYPDISPPVVNVRTAYLGASAAVVESRVTQVIEDQIAGIEGIRNISSASNDGSSNVTIEFNLGRDIDSAANDVRDRVSRVLDVLPEEADPPEVSKADASGDVIMWLNLASQEMNELELTDYADRFLIDRLSTVDGVAQVRIGGERRYAMRVWIDRIALAARGLTVTDIEDTLRSENVELPAGRIESIEREFTVRVDRGYRTAEDFGELVLGQGDDGYLIRLREVADVEIGPEDDRSELRGNGEPMIGLGIIPQSTANTLDVARGVQAEVERINQDLPEGLNLFNSYDASVFVDAAVREVYVTLAIAMVLVIFVIYMFLGNVRATLIPAVTVPVSLIASLIILAALGFTLNLLTLLALVLAIGLVVDDAIVVLENISRRIEQGEAPLLAAYRGARQVGFAVIATTLVLIAVFVPISFLQGNIGRLFTEFAFALAAAVGFSSLVALTLSPMMCSKLLRGDLKPNWLTQRIDAGFKSLTSAYQRLLDGFLKAPWIAFVIILVSFGGIAGLWKLIPQELAPPEDRGVFFIFMTGPEGSSFEYSQKYMREIEDDLLPLLDSGEAKRVLVRTPSFFGGGTSVNGGIAIVVLEDWGERDRSTQEIMGAMMPKLLALPGVRAFPVARSGIARGVGAPVQFVIGGGTYQELAIWRDIMLEAARENPGLINPDADYKETKPQFRIDIDRTRAADLGISVRNIGRTLETMMGSRLVTTYLDRGEEYNVVLQGRDQDRMSPDDLRNLYVRSERTGELIPLSNVITIRETADSNSLNRFNRLRAITISATLADGYSLGEALTFLRETARDQLPETAQIDYKGQSQEFMDAGGAIFFTFALALIIVFLVLAAQFESFFHPISILLTVPLAILGALAGLWLAGFFDVPGDSLNIFSQIGLIMLIGLSAKNGILIVEFANQLRDQGLAVRDAILRASAIRLRPILMTALSTAMGAIPLILATGAGAESRFSIGVVVFAGVISATLFTLFVTPALYLMLGRFSRSPQALRKELEQLEEATVATH